MKDYSTILQTLLKKRGLTKSEEINAFLHPSYNDDLHDPFLMLGMSTAVERVLKAITNGEKIAIYSDFDADGIPAGVLLHDFFKKIGLTPVKSGSQKPDHVASFINYIPHRDTEGYGLHTEAVEKLAKQGVSLIITVDVGITAVNSVELANKLGVDVIITDHHEPQEQLPNALAILNPKQKDCEYPFDGLCGAGVAYKLVQALILKGKQQRSLASLFESIPTGWEKWLLDLVAISTVADMVPLIGENRALVHWGLKVLHKSPRLGVIAMCNKLRINQQLLDENDIGFSIGPRINASSRMGHPEDAFNLLTAESIEEAEALVSKLESLNNKRKGMVATITKQVKAKLANLEARLTSESNKVIVTGDPSWSPALVGLSAGSLADSLGKVVCIWGREGTGALKGSCRRGTTDYSVVEMFEAASDSLLGFGGHHAAGGFSVSDEQVHTLGNALNIALNSVKITIDTKNDEQKYDIELTLRDVNLNTIREIVQLAPFGINNPKPIIKFAGVTINSVRHFGKEQNHLEIYIKDANGASRKAGKFFATAQSFGKELVEGRVIDLYVNMEESSFAGRRTLELRIVDIV